MKKIVIALLLALLCLLSACGHPVAEEEGNAQAVYFLMEGEQGRTLAYEVIDLQEDTLQLQIEAVLEAMRTPVNTNHTALLSEDIQVRAVEIFGSTVVIRLTGGYDQLSTIGRSLLDSAITLSLCELEEVRYVRITGDRSNAVGFMSESSVVLEDSDLRLSAFDIEVYPVDSSTDRLVPYQLHISSEQEVLTPRMVLDEMMAGTLGEAAPFDGRMDIRSILSTGEHSLRAELYVPVEMDLQGREVELWSVVNTLCSCRGIEEVTIIINGSDPSERGLQNCDGPLRYDAQWIG